ncbi:MAG: TRAP transporter large permease subunit [Oscillospiraceae bacterium]|nr:TRAP transporter large permease subunit [Oscillospiraceae bacterium]
MFATSIAGILWMYGPTMVLTQFTNGPFTLSASYSYAIMPLFTMMGILATETGIAQGAYNSMRCLLSKMHGSLLYTTIAGNAIFGACCGNGNAGSIVFARIALPEMERYDYDKKLSLGCVTASGALSGLIPPSVPICQISILAGYSVGTALMYGLATGILTTIVMFAIVWVELRIHPEKAPPVTEEDRQITWKEKLASLKLLVPIALLFMLIIGGTFFGWFHPTVGGAIGAGAVVIYALFKRVPVKRILSAAWESAHIFAGVYLIIVSGTMFSRMISLSGLTTMLVNAVANSGLPVFAVVALIIVFYLISGCVMDILAVIVVTVPVVFPILVDSMGFDPFVLIIICVMAGVIGGITPPIGTGVFTISNVTRVPTQTIFQGVWPFVIAELIVVVVIAVLPWSISWLPNLLAALQG